MSEQNLQSKNVGNMGDILKHAALIAGIDALLKHARTLTYVDTHAFTLEAPCANPGRWLNESRDVMRRHEGYRRYVELQPTAARRPSVYRCSSGLAVDVIRKRTGSVPTLVLAESNDSTRQRLRQQLAAERIDRFTLLTQAEDLGKADTPTTEALYALIDPFKLDDGLWHTVSPQLSRLAASVRHAVVQVFTHERRPDVSWPEPPSGFVGPVATIDADPFHLAAYTTPGVAEDIAAACTDLGWTAHPVQAEAEAKTQPQQAAPPAQASDISVLRRVVGEGLKHFADPPQEDADEAAAPRPGQSVRVRGFSALRALPHDGLREAIDLAIARVVDDPRASLVHQRRLTEVIVSLTARARGVDLSDCSDSVDRIRRLEAALRLNHHVVTSLHWVRLRGNAAVHDPITALGFKDAVEGLEHCYRIQRWYLAESDSADHEPFAVGFTDTDAATPRQQRREDKLRRDMAGLVRQLDQLKRSHDEPRELLEQRREVAAHATVLLTVPDASRLKWVYFATPSRASRDNTYDLAYEHGIICCDVYNSTGMLKPNVGRLSVGDLILLAYGQGGSYSPELYVQVEAPFGSPLGQTSVMSEMPEELTPLLKNGYSPDPRVGRFTGFRVTPCSDWKGHKLTAIKKPTGQNFLRRWDEVREFNGL